MWDVGIFILEEDFVESVEGAKVRGLRVWREAKKRWEKAALRPGTIDWKCEDRVHDLYILYAPSNKQLDLAS